MFPDHDAAVETRLRRLDGDALAALVADLWAARGFETRRAGRTVVADRDGVTTRILVAGGNGRAGDAEEPVDVVVATGGDAVMVRHGARRLDAADLEEMLAYAVDGASAAAIRERHLGPVRDAPPGARVRRRLRAGVAGLAARVTRRARGWREGPRSRGTRAMGPMAAGIALAVVLVVAGVGFVSVAGERGGTGNGGTPPATATPADVPTATVRPVFPGLSSVPGVTAAGITDASALATAHARRLGDRYTIWLDRRRPPRGAPDGPVRQRDVDVAVAGDRYLLEASTRITAGDQPLLSVYDDGDRLVVAEHEEMGVTYRALPPGTASPATVPEPDVLRRTLVARYLASPETDVTGTVEEDGRKYYRVVGEGVPADGPDVEDYRVVALIDPRGFVADLSAEYVVRERGRRVPVTFEVTYGRRGRTSVSPPAWYGEAAGGGNATEAGTARAEGTGSADAGSGGDAEVAGP